MAMSGGSGQPEMNVTPLIDVLLVLIIVFMIIVPVAPRGVQADIPREANKNSAPDTIRTIVIQLHAEGCSTLDVKSHAKECPATLRINEQPVSWENLRSRLMEIYKERAEKVAFVKADPELEFEQVAEIIDIALVAGVDTVELMK